MTIRVYQFHLDAPIAGERAVRETMSLAHAYAIDLIAIERGRRDALRAVHDTPSVREAEALVKAATRSTRKAAVRALWSARRDAERAASVVDETIPEIAAAIAMLVALPKDVSAKARSFARRMLKEARAANGDELARIALLDESIRRDARALTRVHWGTYLTIEASADQARKAPLYADDHLTPASPRFRRGGHRGHLDGSDARHAWWCAPSQIGMHVQGRVCKTSDVLAARDAWVHLEDVEPLSRPAEHQSTRRAVLALRIDVDTWARWPVRMHREIPDAARWSWVRVSCRPQRGASGREQWSVEITLDDPAPRTRDLDTQLHESGRAIAVELLWTPLDDGQMRVARWLDSAGQRGEVLLPREMVRGLGEIPAGIRSVRDALLNELRPKLARALRETDLSWTARKIAEIDYARGRPIDARTRRQSGEPPGAYIMAAHTTPGGSLPSWLTRAVTTLHLWRSPSRFVELARQWRASKYDGARVAYELLDAWEQRDAHLDDYEDGTRARSLRWRRETYRVLAARWSRAYATVLVPDRDLSREARWGEKGEARFLASPQELRNCLRQAFGAGAEEVAWRGPHGVLDEGGEDDTVSEWLEMACEQWRGTKKAGGARLERNSVEVGTMRGGAWARRQAAARERDVEREAARKASGNSAE